MYLTFVIEDNTITVLTGTGTLVENDILLGLVFGTNRGTNLGINLEITLELTNRSEFVAITKLGLLFLIVLGLALGMMLG